MKRLMLISALCLLQVFGVSTSDAKDNKVFKVGISVWTGYPDSVRGFKESMAAGGLIEGKNIEYIFGRSGIDKNKQRQIVESFKKAKVDLVYSLTTPGTVIAKEIMPPSTPIVFSIVTYPADSGLIDSFEFSGNNLVGTSNYVEFKNYVKLLKTMLPNAKKLAIFHRKGEPNSKIQAANIIRLLKKEGVDTIDMEPRTVDEMHRLAVDIADKVDVFMTTTDTLCQGGGESALIKVSREKKIPILSSNKNGIAEGSTFGPVADFYTLGKISGQMALKILKENIKPYEIESRLQDPPLILINKKSVKSIGIKVPEGKLPNMMYME